MATIYKRFPSASGGSANPSVGINGQTAPTSSTEVGGINPGGNLQPLQTDASGNLLVNINSETGAPFHVIVDSSALPTGAATQTTLATVSTTLGSILLDLTNGTQVTSVNNFPATQPVSGTVTANQGTPGVGAWPTLAAQSGTWDIRNISGTVSLPTGASTAAKQPALGTAGTASSDVITVQGITSMTPLKVDGTGGTFPVSGTIAATQSGTWNITNISGTVSLPTGAATAANQATEITSLASIVTNTNESTTSAITSVNGSGTSVSLLALNANRKQAAFYNDSTAILYLKLGSTASTTSYTVQLVAGAYYELPWKSYTGAIDGIWASATGAVRITELT